MAIIGQYSTTDLLQKEYLNELPAARTILRQFNTLNTLFASFQGYEAKQYKKTRNVILHFCLPDICGKVDTKRLAEVEDSLLIFDVLSWNKTHREHLKERLCNDDYYKSLSQYMELTYAKWLAEKLGKKNVVIYPRLTTGKISDVSVDLNGKRIFLEIGNLSESLPEKKIQEIVDKAALHLGKKLKDRVLMLLEVDTTEFLTSDDKKYIDVKASAEKLIAEFDRLCLDEIADYDGRLDINEIAETLRFKKDIENLLQKSPSLILPSDKKQIDLINSPPISRWISSSKGQVGQGSKIITWISIHKAKFLLVEVHPQMFYPSTAAQNERDSFINHVIRHIEGQLDQLQPGSSNIIVVQGYNWVIFQLGEDFEGIEPLSLKIQEFLGKNQQKYLSGVAIFANDFAKSVFITNDYAESKLTKDDIEKLGMRIVSQ